MTDLILVKVKYHRQPVEWELVRPIATLLVDDAEAAHALADAIADNVVGVKEVRWNWEGSLQGHYVSPKAAWINVDDIENDPTIPDELIPDVGDYLRHQAELEDDGYPL